MSDMLVLDRVTLPAAEATAWLDRLRAEYLPGARRREMRLTGIWWAYADTEAIEVYLTWELTDDNAFWQMRGAAGADPAVAEWWAATDEIALHRERRVLADGSAGIAS